MKSGEKLGKVVKGGKSGEKLEKVGNILYYNFAKK